MWRRFLETAIRCQGIFGVIVILSGCAVTIPAPEEQRSAAQQPPRSGTAKLIVFRIKAFKAGGAKTPVFVDGRLLGYNRSGTFIVCELPLGNHAISTGISRVNFVARAGQTYYCRQSPNLGWTSEEANLSTVEMTSTADGLAHIAGAEQGASMF
jgi:hypothetical protein